MKEIIERAERLGYEVSIFYCMYDPEDLSEIIIYIELCLIQKWMYDPEDLSEIIIYIELCLIQKWIYEKFGIWVEIVKYPIRFTYQINDYSYGIYNTPRQALEEGIKKALEILERAERLGYHIFFNDGVLIDSSKNHGRRSLKNLDYIELCLIQKWIYEKFGVWVEIKPDQALEEGIKKELEILEKL